MFFDLRNETACLIPLNPSSKVSATRSTLSHLISGFKISAKETKEADFDRRLICFLKLMKEIPGLKTNTPQGAFYVYPEISSYFGKKYENHTINSGTDLSLFLLDVAHVALVPGAAFGSDNYIRFSYATDEKNLTEAVKRMGAALAKLH
jgi:aspartate aminotransferase